MGKIVYETTLLVCSSCVIFTGTVSAVLLMLAWPNDRILGLSTRMVIGLCVIIVAIFSVGFVGTIAESIRALLIYACLLILFPVSVLLVEIILRVSSVSPVAVAVPPTQSLSTAAPITPKSTLIFSNSFTSNSVGHAPLPASSSVSYSERNFSLNSISVSPSPPLYALLPSPSLVQPANSAKFNLSTQPQLPLTSSPLPTDFYLLFKDGYLDTGPSELSKQVKASTSVNNATDLSTGTGHTQPKSTFLKATRNFWSDILTTSLSPRVETLVEYVLIGMLAFVLIQIGIAYLLASEIRTLRSELAMLASMQFNKRSSDLDEEEVPNLLADQPQTNLVQFDKELIDYCELQCFDSVQSQLPLTCPASSDCSANFASDFCLLTFQQSMPLVQVHTNPDSTPTVAAIATEPANSFNSNYVNVIIDETLANKPTQFASSMSSSALTTRTNRRSRLGSFRVTFDSAPEYFESNTESYGETVLAPATVDVPNQCQQQQPEQHYQS